MCVIKRKGKNKTKKISVICAWVGNVKTNVDHLHTHTSCIHSQFSNEKK